ncbi:MAG: 30S ribosomal protein S15 [Thermoplasmatota archaeon]
MSRLHKGSKGKSGSKRPLREKAPDWKTISSAEVEETIVKLARDGNSAAKIGLILRDQYAIPDVRLALGGKRISDVLQKNSLTPQVPDDLQALIRTSVSLQNHLAQHPKDLHNRRGLHLLESKIRRLAKYYKRMGRIPIEWRYESGQAQLMVE